MKPFYYDLKKTFDERVKETSALLKKYPDKIPIIVENNVKFHLERNKFLCPHDMSVGQFILILRNRINLNPSQSIYIFHDGKTFKNDKMMLDMYKLYGDTDKFLKLNYELESVFG